MHEYRVHMREEDLVDGGWYRGYNRNGHIGQWSAERRNFSIRREKFGETFTQWVPLGHQISGCFNATKYLGQERPEEESRD